jgi:hypothetical protein
MGARRTGWVWLALAAFVAGALAMGPAFAGGIAVKSGGVGLDERAALEAERDRYNVRLAFAQTSGVYVSDVNVKITRPDGALVYEGRDEGPWFFAQLEPGTYRLIVDYDGMTQVRTLQVQSHQAAPLLYLHWPGGASAAGQG